MPNLFDRGNFKTLFRLHYAYQQYPHSKLYLYCGRMSGDKGGNNKNNNNKPKNVMSKEEEYESKLSFATERMYTLRTCSSKVVLHFMKTVGEVP